MLTYELCLLVRALSKPELTTILKRTCVAIFEKGGVIRKINNLGTNDIPYKVSLHGLVHKKASFFLLQIYAPPTSVDKLLDEFSRDIDIIRRRLYKQSESNVFDCTLHDEMLPAPYRKNVQELIKHARLLDKPKFCYNTGLNYYPFQK